MFKLKPRFLRMIAPGALVVLMFLVSCVAIVNSGLLSANLLNLVATTGSTSAMSCGNSAGDDGLYSACVGDTIAHTPTGIKLKVVSYTAGNVLLSTSLNLKSGGTISTLSLNKNVPVVATLTNGTVFTTKYTETSDKYGAFIQIESEIPPAMSCGNSADEDGLYSACIGDTITHYPTGIKLKVVSYTDGNVKLSTSIDLKSGGTIHSLSLNKNVPVVATLTDGTEFKTTYTETSDTHGAFIQIDSEIPPAMSCGNSAGDDGLYSACAGDTITHWPTGIKLKVVSYTDGNVKLSTSIGLKSGGTIHSLSLNKNVPVVATLTDGTEFRTTYTEMTDKHGAFIKITSKKPAVVVVPVTQPVTTPTTSKNNYENEVITADSGKNPFSDTDMNTLLGVAASKLHSLGIIGGYPDGEFKGSRPVNRAEAAKFLMISLYGEQLPNIANNGKFWDVLDGQWYTPYIMNAYANGIMSGYQDGSIKPGNTVNTAEFLKMFTLTFGLEQNLPYDYTDVPSEAWYASYAGIAEEYKLFPNRSTGLLPSSLLTREEVAIAFYNYLLNK